MRVKKWQGWCESVGRVLREKIKRQGDEGGRRVKKVGRRRALPNLP